MPEEYRFTGRSRQPATDAFNAMLDYSYGVFYSLLETTAVRRLCLRR
jgi:CRISPR-associated protein Cas1